MLKNVADMDWMQTVHRSMSAIYLLCGLIGLFLHVFNVRRLVKLSHWLSSGTLTLHLYLTICHLGILFGIPFCSYSAYFGKWMFGETACQMYAFEGMLFGNAGNLLLAALCIDRYGDAFNCRWYKKMKLYHFHIVALGLLFVSICWAHLPFVGFGIYAPEPQGTSCLFNWMNRSDNSQIYLLLLMLFFWVLPYTIAVGSLASVWLFDANKADNRRRTLTSLVFWISMCQMLGWVPYVIVTSNGYLLQHEKTLGLEAMFTEINLTMAYLPVLTIKWTTALLPLIYAAVLTGIKEKKRQHNKKK